MGCLVLGDGFDVKEVEIEPLVLPHSFECDPSVFASASTDREPPGRSGAYLRMCSGAEQDRVAGIIVSGRESTVTCVISPEGLPQGDACHAEASRWQRRTIILCRTVVVFGVDWVLRADCLRSREVILSVKDQCVQQSGLCWSRGRDRLSGRE